MKLNNYELGDEYGICYASNTNDQILFDLEDYDLIKNFTWCVNSVGYAVATNNKKQIYMHRLVTHNSFVNVDHIYGNKLDNRKSQLRACSKAQNLYNKPLRSNNTSGITGVHWIASNKTWRAYINVSKEKISLGCYKDFNEAVKARLQAELKYFGDFAPQKHLFTQYDINLEKEI